MYRLRDAFPYLLNRVGVRMGELFSRRLEPYGVTLPMYRVMATLWEAGDRRLGELSEVTSIELSTLSRLVGTMMRKGLLSRKRPDANARTVEINLTTKGRALVEELIPQAKLHEDVGLRPGPGVCGHSARISARTSSSRTGAAWVCGRRVPTVTTSSCWLCSRPGNGRCRGLTINAG